ncbi:MAG TPA: M28 family peptidase [Blattabacteriaceae bacterium]|nr:M28 family peptidase [Blattabacteriaceae bacterium]
MAELNQAGIAAKSQKDFGAPSLLNILVLWGFIIALAVLSITAVHPPQPLPATAPENEFSAQRALIHVREIASVPHPLGSAADAAARNYLVAQLTQLGLQPQIFSSLGVDSSGRLIIAGKINDIVGRLPGTASAPAIVLMAHYDSVYSAPGAGDDASGVASILEILRALKHGPPIQRNIIVLFTDGEEAGLLGAEAFSHSHPWMRDAGLILNFEARGNRGPSLLFETSQNNRPLIGAVAHVAPYPIGSSLFYELYKILPNDTDFTVFRPAGIPGLNFAFGEGLEAYHSPLDTPDHLSLASLQHHGSYGLALTRHFGQLDLAALRNSQGDDVFFDWFGSRLVAYSQRWVLPGQILITLLLPIALLLAFRRPEFSKKRFLFGLLACLVILILLVATVAAVWWLISFVLADRRVIGDCPANLFLLSALMLFGACVGMLLVGFFRKRLGQQELSLAALSLWFVLSWLLALELPSGSYLLFWPLLLGLLGNAASNFGNKSTVHQSRAQWTRNLPALAAAILLFAPVIYLVYIFLTLQMISAAASALLLGLFLLISLPTLGLPSISSRGWASGLLAIAAIICLGCGLALSGYSPEHPRPDSILYSVNADDNTAVWISYDQKPDDWTRQFFGANSAPHPVPNYLAGFARPLISASTPKLPLAPPVIENVEHKQEGGVHRLKLRLRSQRKAETLYLRFPDDVQPVAAKVAGRDVPVRKGSRFGLTLYAMGDEGVELELTVQAPSALSFWIMDRSYGLPINARPRPSNIIGMDGSDATYVCRKYVL